MHWKKMEPPSSPSNRNDRGDPVRCRAGGGSDRAVMLVPPRSLRSSSRQGGNDGASKRAVLSKVPCRLPVDSDAHDAWGRAVVFGGHIRRASPLVGQKSDLEGVDGLHAVRQRGRGRQAGESRPDRSCPLALDDHGYGPERSVVKREVPVAGYFNDTASRCDLRGDRLCQCGRHEDEHGQAKRSPTYDPLKSDHPTQPPDATGEYDSLDDQMVRVHRQWVPH